MASGGGGNSAAAAAMVGGPTRRRRGDRPYKGIRMRKWGKWVAEIREPNKRTRIWLGSYSTAVAAARAYDTAVYYLRGPAAKLNFPGEVSAAPLEEDLSPAAIREKAVEVGARVDALQTNTAASANGGHAMAHGRIDLNKLPDPEGPGGEYW